MKKLGRKNRHKRITKKVKGTKEQPRLLVFRSKKHIYAQLIDDSSDRVIAGCSTLSKDFKQKDIKSSNKEGAKELGKLISEKAKVAGIQKVCLDRGGYKYHGRVKNLAEGAREGGLKL